MKALAKQLLKPLKSMGRHTPAFVQQWGHNLLADLHIDSEPFKGFSDTIRPSMAKVANTRFYRHAEQSGIPGWLSPKERQVLYALGRWLPGPITEIGSWVGLSTTAIARGIKDSKQPKEFRTYDLRLTEDQFRLIPGGIGSFLPNDDVCHAVCTEEFYRVEIQPILSSPGGSNGMLKRHLADLGLLDNTEIFVGDFRAAQPITSSVLFCDCLHDDDEIRLNAPALGPWLQRGSILACHDVGGVTSGIDLLRKHVPLGHGLVIDSLYVAEVSNL
jgi:hypothetical protein